MQFKSIQVSFCEETVKKSAGATILAIASLFIVFFFFPSLVHADEIVYFEDFEDGVFNGCSELNGAITTGSAYSGSKKLSEGSVANSVVCSSNLYSTTTSIYTYTFYLDKIGISNADIDFKYAATNLAIFRVSLFDSEVEVNGVVVGAYPSDWFKVQVVQNGDSLVARVDDTGPWVQVDTTSGRTYPATGIKFDESDNRVNLDDFSVYSGDSADSNLGVNCSTCTRVVSIDPSPGEHLATSTAGQQVTVVYYVSDGLVSSDDYCNQVFGIGVCTTKISVGVKSVVSSEIYTYVEEVSAGGEELSFFHFYDQINHSGTYWIEVRIYNTYVGGSYVNALNEEVLYYVSTFYIGTPNTPEEIAGYVAENGLTDRVERAEAGSLESGTLDDPSFVSRAFEDLTHEFLLFPPWGYITIFNETLQNGTSTAIGTMNLSFATSSPAYGKTLSLPITGASEDGIQYLRDHGVTGDQGDSWDTAIYYWNLFWYIAFIIWLMRELFGLFSGVNLDSTHTVDLSKSRVVGNQRVDNKRGTLDLRK